MNNYQIYDVLGKGRHSTVYKGRKKKSVEYFAIASIEKSQRTRILNSVQFLRSLSHPNILTFNGWYETNNHFWVITEMCTGGDVRSILQADNVLPEVNVRVLAADIALGMSHMHSKGVIYGDLKPSNVLLHATGYIKFYDFGLSLHVNDAGKSTRGRVGTPSYMAPELFEDDGVPSIASDLWSFGCMLYEMVVGAPPFTGGDLQELITNILQTPFTKAPNASSTLNALLEQLLVKNPADRATWADVASSEFFPAFSSGSVPELPSQPAFEDYVRRHKSTKETPKKDSRTNALRASVNAERNLSRLKAISAAIDDDDHDGVGEERGKGRDAAGKKRSSNNATQSNNGGVELDEEMDFGEGTLNGGGGGDAAATAPSLEGTRANSGSRPGTASNAAAGIPMFPTPELAPPTPSVTQANVDIPRQINRRKPVATNPAVKRDDGTGGGGGDGARGGGGSGAGAVDDELSIASLMVHPQDAHLRPLVNNHRIERYPDPNVDKANVRCKLISNVQLRELPVSSQEAHLTSIYQALAPTSGASLEERLATLSYLETLCTDAHIAEAVVNSSIIKLLAELVKSDSNVDSLRAHAATVMGLLVRHADQIHHSSTSFLIPALMLVLGKQCAVPLKRRALACLGELLFYIATRPESERASWGVTPTEVTGLLISTLGCGDEITVHYAAKLVENTASLTDLTAAARTFGFASKAIVDVMLVALKSTTSDQLRTTLYSALFKLTSANPTLFPYIMDGAGAAASEPILAPSNFFKAVASANPIISSKALQCYLTMCIGYVGMYLTSSPAASHASVTKVLNWVPTTVDGLPPLEAQGPKNVFFAAVEGAANAVAGEGEMRLLVAMGAGIVACPVLWEHPTTSIRGKALLLSGLLCMADPIHTQDVIASDSYLVGGFASPSSSAMRSYERLVRDRDAYVSKCVDAISSILRLSAVRLLSIVAAMKCPPNSLKASLFIAGYAAALPGSYLRPTTPDTTSVVLTSTGRLFQRVGGPSSSADTPGSLVPHTELLMKILDAIPAMLALTGEASSGDSPRPTTPSSSVAGIHAKLVASTLLPSTLPLLGKDSPCQAAFSGCRYNIARAALDLLLPVVTDPNLYNPSQSTSSQVQLVQDVNKFMADFALHVPSLLADDGTGGSEMLSVVVLKLLSCVCERSPNAAKVVASRALIDHLASRLKSTSLNVHVVSLLLRLLQSADEDTTKYAVVSHKLIPTCIGIATKNLQDWEVMEAVLTPTAELFFFIICAAVRNPTSDVALLCGHFVAGSNTTPVESLLLRMCVDHVESAASDCAASCVFMLCQLFNEARQVLVSPRVMVLLREILDAACRVDGQPRDTRSSQSIAGNPAAACVVAPHTAIPIIRALMVVTKVNPTALQSDELLLMLLQNIQETSPHPQLQTIAKDLLAVVFS